jgi:outer membrane protein assembly factor BamB
MSWQKRVFDGQLLVVFKDSTTELTHRDASKMANHRFWIPISIGSTAIAGIGFFLLLPDLDLNFKTWVIAIIAILAVLLGLVWFVALSRFRLRTRMAALGILVVAVACLALTIRVDGTLNGTGLPKLAWRWDAPQSRIYGASHTILDASRKNAMDSPSDVPQFFGPNRDGIITNAGLDPDWTTSPPKQLWRQPIGAGWSAFAVVGARAYTEEQRGETECVTCYDLFTGQLLWSHSNAAHFSQWQSGDGPHATPSVYQRRVFSMGATGILNCLDSSTGQLLWTRNVLAENNLRNLTWGVSDSPLVFGNTVVVTGGGRTNGPAVLAYRASDGKPLWSAGQDQASYASPILTTLAGRRVVLSCNGGSLTAHDLATGEVLLNYPWGNDKWPKASQPVMLGEDRVFLSAGYGLGCLILKVTSGAGGKLVATQLWKNMRMKTQFNSAAVRDGFLYGLDDGMLACIDASTGERRWKEGRYGYGQTLLVDSFVLIQCEAGDVVIGEAKPDGFTELGRISALHKKTWNYPTLAGRYLLVRNDEEAVCYELPLHSPPGGR